MDDHNGPETRRVPFPGVEGEPTENPRDMNHMVQIDKVIADLSSIKERFGNTCVYIRRAGVAWGAVALNRRDADEKHGVFDLQTQHDRDMLARCEQIDRLVSDKQELWKERDEHRAEIATLRSQVETLREALGMVHATCVVHDKENQCVECKICRAECNEDEPLVHRHDCPLAETGQEKPNIYIACGNCQENITHGVCPWRLDPVGGPWLVPCPIRRAAAVLSKQK